MSVIETAPTPFEEATSFYKRFAGGEYTAARPLFEIIVDHKLNLAEVISSTKVFGQKIVTEGKTEQELFEEIQLQHATQFLQHFRQRFQDLEKTEPKTKMEIRSDDSKCAALQEDFVEAAVQLWWDIHFSRLEPKDLATKLGRDPDADFDIGRYTQPLAGTDINLARSLIFTDLRNAMIAGATRNVRLQITAAVKNDGYDATNISFDRNFFYMCDGSGHHKGKQLVNGIEAVQNLAMQLEAITYFCQYDANRTGIWPIEQYFGYSHIKPRAFLKHSPNGTLKPQK